MFVLLYLKKYHNYLVLLQKDHFHQGLIDLTFAVSKYRLLGLFHVYHSYIGVPDDKMEVAEILKGDLLNGVNAGGSLTLEKTGESMPIGKVLSPVDPPTIYCIGLNYEKHYQEGVCKKGLPRPQRPEIFMKPITCTNHHMGDILSPSSDALVIPAAEAKIASRWLDYEGELVIVIGKKCKSVKKEDALDYVLGYTCGNDVTERYWQKAPGSSQWIRGKSFDSFAPMGPVLVPGSDNFDPNNVNITTKVNNKIRQDSNTSDMMFSVQEIVAWVSNDTTLLPGTCIFTGTPEGVGAYTKSFLKDKDVVQISIEGIGTLENHVV